MVHDRRSRRGEKPPLRRQCEALTRVQKLDHVLLQSFLRHRSTKVNARIIARLTTAIRYPEPPVDSRTEEQIDDDDLEAKENHVKSGLGIIPARIRGQPWCRPSRPSPEPCYENGEEICHSQNGQFRAHASCAKVFVVRPAR